MERRVMQSLKAVMVCGALLTAVACGDDQTPSSKTEVSMEITDAPSDDASIKSVMITVAEVKVNGQKLEGFSRQTFDIKAYQEGSTRMLGTTTMDAKTYSNVELVLDLKEDASSGNPGCYVLTHDNQVYSLGASGSETLSVMINNTWKASADATNRMVIDFDLRKSLRRTEDSGKPYTFVSSTNLNSAVRIISKDGSGFVKGTYSEESNVDAEKIIVFAYKKGTFNAATETQAQTSDGIYFKNAVASSEVKSSITGNAYTLAYLPEGDYELHFVAFNRQSESGRLEMSAMLKSETSVNGSAADFIHVKAGLTTNITASISGVME
jgi:hypothetical protein